MPRLILFAICCALLATDRGIGQEKYADPPITAADRQHWAFVPPKRPTLPTTKQPTRNPIDAFIVARLERDGLKLSPEADRLTLIRRVTLDLTGLPPTPAEVEAFLKDNSPQAYEKVVDRLLASPHFGERWAQHWLDVVRFADSNGFEADGDRPHAWRYRDYVVKCFNDDKPYDRFLTEQLAGDELAAGKDPKTAAELWIATGMHRCGPVHMVGGNLDPAQLRQELLTEMVNGIGSVFLGMTVGCARCHDHKFDPFSAGDYYRLQAFFGSAVYTDVDFATPAEREQRKKAADELNAKLAPLKAQVTAIDAPYRAKISKAKHESLEPKYKEALAVAADKRTAEQKKLAMDAGPLTKVTWEEVLMSLTAADREKRAAIREKIHALEAQTPPPTAAAWAIKNGEARETFVLKRGDTGRKAISVTPAFPRIVDASGAAPKSRLELAKWLTTPDHPLTARVMVNRLWHYHFGRGIVTTPNDFGTRGERPTHPELLDWLASELVAPSFAATRSGARPEVWSLKHIHRLIVTSDTYRQSASAELGTRNSERKTTVLGFSIPHSALRTPHSEDPGNKLLWRMNRRRLEAEAIRDSILTAAGTLNPAVGGHAVKVPLEPEVYDLIFTEAEPDGLWPVTPDATQHTRRSLYLFNKRNVRLPMLEALDQPDTLNSCAFRPVSTFAPQALILMNGPFVREQGKALALALVKEHGTDTGKQLDALYRRAVGRSPREDERKLALEFLDAQAASIRTRLREKLPIGIEAKELPEGADMARVRALADLCVVIFNTHEFVYVP